MAGVLILAFQSRQGLFEGDESGLGQEGKAMLGRRSNMKKETEREATKMSIDRRIDKLHFFPKMKYYTAIKKNYNKHSDLDKPHKPNVKQRKLDPKGYITLCVITIT